MTDPRELFVRYLEQRQAVDDDALILPEPVNLASVRAQQGEEARPHVAKGKSDPARATAVHHETGREEVMPSERPGRQQTKKGVSRRSKAKRGEPKWRIDAPAIPGPGLVVHAPPKDLFSEDPVADATLQDIDDMVRRCTRCPLHATRVNGVPGEGPADAGLFVVGEGPGANEDQQGRPFVGRAGDLLNEILASIECPRETVYIANILKSRAPNNRKPQADEIEACIPYLHRQLEIIRPKVILAMGATAAETLLNTRGSLASLRGKVHEYRGIPLIVTYHPAALLRNPHWKRPTWDDVRIARQLLER